MANGNIGKTREKQELVGKCLQDVSQLKAKFLSIQEVSSKNKATIKQEHEEML